MIKTTVLFFLLFKVMISAPTPSTVYKIDGKYKVVSGLLDPKGHAYGWYDSSLFETGWDRLSLSTGTDKAHYDYDKAYAMGYLEGVLTQTRIYDHFSNLYRLNYYYENNSKMPDFVADFVDKQRTWIRNSFLLNEGDPYWQNVFAIARQLEGLRDGYNSVAPPEKQLSYADFHVVATDFEIGDLLNLDPARRPKYEAMNASKAESIMEPKLHCSALIKVKDDLTDIFFGHNTWANYVKMSRIFKEYHLNFSKIRVKAQTIRFSSYPGTLGSLDDYYITSTKLGVMETTNSIFNMELYDLIVPESLFFWHRAQTANRMSENGKEWTEIYAKHNSGTYNNQIMILDFKKFDPEKPLLQDGTLWVSEQMPGTIVSEDMTEELRTKGYWASYNTPYFPKIQDVSGVALYLSLHPEGRFFYDHEHGVRPNIFRRDQGKVQDFESLQRILRYNDYENDPLSFKNPKYSIASRNDLNTSILNCTGATDAKAYSFRKMVTDDSISIISGPTNERQPTFDWKTAKCTLEPRYQWVGEPESYDFKWEEVLTTFQSGRGLCEKLN